MIDRMPIPESTMTYNSLDVAELTGVSLRQLQWWDEQGLVTPMQAGHRRMYTAFEVLQISLIMGLRGKGMSLQKIRPLLNHLNPRQVLEAVRLDDGDRDVYFLTDGKAVYLEEATERIVGILRDSERPISAICVSDLYRDLGLGESPRKPVGVADTGSGRPAAGETAVQAVAEARAVK
ncbi:MAG: MerR family transcriptional regulator [Bryobacterales bacterium]|nr:MerR family transcriptional regulator [Bryobacterales bacterium]